jgi:hypothetical protein
MMIIAGRRLEVTELIAAAASAGEKVSTRSIELWRRRGLLPRPERGGGRTSWLYPAGSDRQLLRLLHWRGRTRYLDEVAICLWLDGFPIDLDTVRASLGGFLGRWSMMIALEIAGAEEATESAMVDALAHKMARMRGKHALPRPSRMRLEDRERACGYLVAAIFGLEEELERREVDLPHLERLLGLRHGHGGGLSPLLGLGDRGEGVARLPTPDRARQALAVTQVDELELVRRGLQLFAFVLPTALPILFADEPVKAQGVIELAEEVFTDPAPALLSFLVLVLVVSVGGKQVAPEDLRGHLESLEPRRARAEFVGLLNDPPAEGTSKGAR